jgi:GNAT superfamily N-acetyltransferase
MVGTCKFKSINEKRAKITAFLRAHGDNLPESNIRAAVSPKTIGNWALRCDGAKIVSGATFEAGTDWYLCTFKNLATDSAYRKQGLGTAVSKEVLHKAIRKPICLMLAADVTFDNEPSKRIVKKLGFVERSRFCWGKGEKPADVLHYVRFPPTGARCAKP